MEQSGLTTLIAAYISNRAEARLEKFDKEAEKLRSDARDGAALAELESVLESDRKELETKYLPVNWLADAAMRAKQIQMVTHALKFTHSDARGSNLYYPGGSQQPEGMASGEVVSTALLATPAIDAVGNAAALDVAALLQLDHNGTTLIQCIEQGDSSPLQPFARDEQQLAEWLDGFRQVLTGNEPSSHKLAKQLYFPVAKDYHLLAPLYSSSLAHAVNSRIAATRYSEESKLTRKARKEGKYHAAPFVEYPDTAVRSYGGTKPQNVSQLNSSQGGKAFLLSCAPPNWKALEKPPLGVKTVFSRNHFGERVWKNVRALQQYLVNKADRDSTKPIRDQRTERVEEILDQLVQYTEEIRNLAGHGGWSALPECKLSRAEQLWLDPQRAMGDEAFAREREKDDWQEVIADQFARWLNIRLKHEKLTMGDAEYGEWKKLALEVLD